MSASLFLANKCRFLVSLILFTGHHLTENHWSELLWKWIIYICYGQSDKSFDLSNRHTNWNIWFHASMLWLCSEARTLHTYMYMCVSMDGYTKRFKYKNCIVYSNTYVCTCVLVFVWKWLLLFLYDAFEYVVAFDSWVCVKLVHKFTLQSA